jgi:hypothetical protein
VVEVGVPPLIALLHYCYNNRCTAACIVLVCLFINARAYMGAGEMPGYPTNTTCYLYAGYDIQMSMHADTNYTGRGARREEQNYKPPPPPPVSD